MVLSKLLLAAVVFLLTAEHAAWFAVATWVWIVLGLVTVAVLLVEAFSVHTWVLGRVRRHPADPVV